MRKLFLASAALALTSPVVANAATFVVTYTGTTLISATAPDANDFATNLNAAGLFSYSDQALINLPGEGVVKYEYMASESGLTDCFTSGVIVNFCETNKSTWAPVSMGPSQIFSAGALAAKFFISGGTARVPGDPQFGVFLPSKLASLGAGVYKSDVLYFGFNDLEGGSDDNHDDFIVRATITSVPEPGTWAMLLSGFAIVGSLVRRRRNNGVTVLA